jgi:hypothetical protein
VPHADVADQALKALAPGSRCSGLALITVDDDDLLVAPAKGNCVSTKCILPLRALDVLDDLSHRGLTNVQVGTAFEVVRLDLERLLHGVLRSWVLIAIVAST